MVLRAVQTMTYETMLVLKYLERRFQNLLFMECMA